MTEREELAGVRAALERLYELAHSIPSIREEAITIFISGTPNALLFAKRKAEHDAKQR